MTATTTTATTTLAELARPFERRVLVVVGGHEFDSFDTALRVAEDVFGAVKERLGTRWLAVTPHREPHSTARILRLLAARGMLQWARPRSDSLEVALPSSDDDRGAAIGQFDMREGWSHRATLASVSGVVALGGDDDEALRCAQSLRAVGLPLRYVPLLGPGRKQGSMHAWVGVEQRRAALSRAVAPLQPLALVEAIAGDHASHAYRPGPCAREDGWALTMHQPWASLVIAGIKRLEGRTWPAAFHGYLWIHAAAAKPDPDQVAAIEATCRSIYSSAGVRATFPRSYPTSALLGCVYIAGVASQAEITSLGDRVPPSLHAENESPFSFLCERPERLVTLIGMGGQHKLWRLSPKGVAAEYAAALVPVAAPQPIVFPVAWGGTATTAASAAPRG